MKTAKKKAGASVASKPTDAQLIDGLAVFVRDAHAIVLWDGKEPYPGGDRKSTRLNSSHRL